MRRVFERLGGTYLKLGQLLSLQADLLPRAYCFALYDLLDSVPPVALEDIENTFRQALGRGTSEVFDRFDESPLASASIAQVHRATLDSRELIVKVRRPEARRHFESDLRLLRLGCRVIRGLHLRPLYWVTRIVGELILWTREEIDFRNEARYQSALAHLTAERSSERVPAVLTELTSECVLVCEFLSGPTILQVLRSTAGIGDPIEPEVLERLGFDAEAVARNLIDNFVGDALQLGIFHADLHPANLLILENNVIGYVDFGITGALSKYTRRHLVSLLLSLLEADAEGLSHHFIRISSLEPGADPHGFLTRIRESIPSWFDLDNDAVRPRLAFTTIMMEMFRVARRHGVLPSADGARYLRSVISLEGLIRQFAPDFVVAEYLESSCRETLELEVLEERLDIERLADWTVAATRLVRKSPALLSRLAERLWEPDRTTPN